MAKNLVRARISFEQRDAAGWVEQFQCAANIDSKSGSEAVLAGRPVATGTHVITVRHSEQTSAVRQDWRLRNTRTGEIYVIKSITDRFEQHQWLEFYVYDIGAGDLGAIGHRAFANFFGEDVLIRRFTGSGTPRPKTDVSARAWVTGYQPQELIGPIVLGDIKVTVMVDTLAAVLPVTTNDKIVIRGKELAIKSVDTYTHSEAGYLVALEIRAGG
jgi:SPP1 family predicted phage head-tail adaptor